jgi:hypothetical protein
MTTDFIRELDELTRGVDLDPTVGAVVLVLNLVLLAQAAAARLARRCPTTPS